MAEAAGSREQLAAGRALTDAPHRAEEELEPASLDAPPAAGRRRERRSGVAAVGAAERFPGGSLAPPAAPDPDACLLEAAKATPRRSSIIKKRLEKLTSQAFKTPDIGEALSILLEGPKMAGDITELLDELLMMSDEPLTTKECQAFLSFCDDLVINSSKIIQAMH